MLERVVPGESPEWLYAEHLARYEFAAQFAKGKNVLDVACGTGYGSELLAEAGAIHVSGVDIAPEAVEHAREFYHHPNLAYHVADAIDLSIFAEHQFDLVVSFETIEHLSDIPRFLREVHRMLRPGGLFIVSTPNGALARLKDQLTGKPSNPHHRIEYRPGQFRRALGRLFRIESLHGQNFIHPLLALLPVQAVAKTTLALLGKRELQNRVYYHGNGPAVRPCTAFCSPRYLIAICTPIA